MNTNEHESGAVKASCFRPVPELHRPAAAPAITRQGNIHFHSCPFVSIRG